MIFVTVGTHEQQFNRLIMEVDYLKERKLIQEEVFIQTGFSDYEPRYCQWKKFITNIEMNDYIEKARIVITHGGPSSFMSVLKIKKTPIVVPRLSKYEEHVNDHQSDFVKKVVDKYKNIIMVEDINNLLNVIENYEDVIIEDDYRIDGNLNFCNSFTKIVNELVGR